MGVSIVVSATVVAETDRPAAPFPQVGQTTLTVSAPNSQFRGWRYIPAMRIGYRPVSARDQRPRAQDALTAGGLRAARGHQAGRLSRSLGYVIQLSGELQRRSTR
jgi:hypothetical protein